MNVTHAVTRRRSPAPDQRGVAAIEFALVLGLLLFLIYGIVGFGLLFLMQQKMTHITGDSARYALVASMSGHEHPASLGCDHAVQHVSGNRTLRMLGSDRISCVLSAAAHTCAPAEADHCVSITMVADVSQWAPLRLVHGLADAAGMRDSITMINQLSATAVVRVRGNIES